MFQVKIWFQNRRMKWKRSKKGATDAKKADKSKSEEKPASTGSNNNSVTSSTNNNNHNINNNAENKPPVTMTIDTMDTEPKDLVTVTKAVNIIPVHDAGAMSVGACATEVTSRTANHVTYHQDVAADLSRRATATSGPVPLVAN